MQHRSRSRSTAAGPTAPAAPVCRLYAHTLHLHLQCACTPHRSRMQHLNRLHSSCCYCSASRAGLARRILIPETNPELSPFASVTCLEDTQQALQPLLPCAGPATRWSAMGLWRRSAAWPLGLPRRQEAHNTSASSCSLVCPANVAHDNSSTAFPFPRCTVAFLIATDLASQQPLQELDVCGSLPHAVPPGACYTAHSTPHSMIHPEKLRSNIRMVQPKPALA